MILQGPLRTLELTYPIFQAPIGAIASPELAAAVSNVGGLGHLACTWRTPDQLRALFKATDALTRKPYGANFVLDFPIEDQLDAALTHGVRLISFFWGDGRRYVRRVKEAGAITAQVVGAIVEARQAADAGFDLIVAQGREAGGHVRGQLGTMTLVPQAVDAVDPVPVLAGGGIVDRRGVAAAVALGAVGVWVGTRFLAAVEANIHERYQDLLVASDGDDTFYSELFNVGCDEGPFSRNVRSAVRAQGRAISGPALNL
jgi:nitronate monooxygenase